MPRRNIEAFNVSFLDCITCGFGAVILLFVITANKEDSHRQEQTADLRGEVDRVERQVLEGERKRLEILNSRKEAERKIVVARGKTREVIDDTKKVVDEKSRFDRDTAALIEHQNRLQADLRTKRRELAALEAANQKKGENVLARPGDGRQQYLTGLRTDFRRFVILVDTSLSMAEEKLEAITPLMTASDETIRGKEKWQRIVNAAEWMLTTMDNAERFQVLAFSENVQTLVPGTDGEWLLASDVTRVREVRTKLRELTPKGGTNLERAFAAVARFNPPPDGILLLTDGLPTRADSIGMSSNEVSGEQRARAFAAAKRSLLAGSRGIPVSTLLFHLGGDPEAPNLYWQLAVDTAGSFLSPYRLWP